MQNRALFFKINGDLFQDYCKIRILRCKTGILTSKTGIFFKRKFFLYQPGFSHRQSLSRSLSSEIGTPFLFVILSTPPHFTPECQYPLTKLTEYRNGISSAPPSFFWCPVQIAFASYERKLKVYLLCYLICV